MKFTTDRSVADPENATRRLMQHAHALEVAQDMRLDEIQLHQTERHAVEWVIA